MPPLHRAIAFEQVDQIAVLVAEQLHFDVPRPADEFFDEDVGAAERGQRFALGRFEGVGEIVSAFDDAHAASAAAVGRLEMTG